MLVGKNRALFSRDRIEKEHARGSTVRRTAKIVVKNDVAARRNLRTVLRNETSSEEILNLVVRATDDDQRAYVTERDKQIIGLDSVQPRCQFLPYRNDVVGVGRITVLQRKRQWIYLAQEPAAIRGRQQRVEDRYLLLHISIKVENA